MPACDRCDRWFNSEHGLWLHERDSSRHNICYDCGLDFSTKLWLKEHLVQSPRHFYCQRCNNHYNDMDELEEHYEEYHYYCRICSKVFDFQVGLHEHNRQVHPYCISCKRVFQTRSNLDAHMRSSVHQGRTVPCPGCRGAFVSTAALILHCESGRCPSGVTRDMVNRVVAKIDRGNVITNPSRLIGYSPSSSSRTVMDIWATEDSWNGYAYECILCHKEFRSLGALNAHLKSPAHQDKMYKSC
ncbi:unnamed protein product [Somion occarium]|uniref:C2H2-type domain-containing protein n=1 Tax=Somion occarium TaxID=3059160 RepID=A0ABP1DIR2_9APHY